MENKSISILKSSKDFGFIKSNGLKAYINKKLLICYVQNNLDTHRVGWTLSRAVGNAVLRNKLKRYSREFFRKENHLDSHFKVDLNLVFLKSGSENFKEMDYNEFRSLLQPVWHKITTTITPKILPKSTDKICDKLFNQKSDEIKN